MEVIKAPKSPQNFDCFFCDYKCYKKRDYDRHILTLKHKKNENGSILEVKKPQKAPNKFICDCTRTFKTHSGFWKHSKKCTNINHDDSLKPTTLDKDNDIKNLVLEVVKTNNELQKQNQEIQKQNQEFQKQILDVCKNTNTTNIVNSNNKAFNLNVFLNETCKDAMDINDFIDSVKLQLSDLELVGKLGFVDGISSIIIKNLKALKVTERPVHCTDLKRETMYVKNQGIWEKQEGDYKNLRKVIKRIAFKNSKNLSLYKELHPDYNDYYSKCSDHFLKLQIEAFGGSGSETIDNENKIIKKIVKEMGIDKKA